MRKKQKYKTEIEDLIFSSVTFRCSECNCEMNRTVDHEMEIVYWTCLNDLSCGREVIHSAFKNNKKDLKDFPGSSRSKTILES